MGGGMWRLARAMMMSLLSVCVAVPLLFMGMMYASTWYYRHRAERVLAYAKTVKLGDTKDIEFRRDLESLGNHVDTFNYNNPEFGPAYISESVQIFNYPSWLNTLAQHIPDPIRGWVGGHMLADWVMFSFEGQFDSKVMTGLKIYEFSCPPACGRPFASIVRVYNYRNSMDEILRSRDEPFEGYRMYPTMLVDRFGKPLPNPVLFKQFVLIDDRGTAEQRGKALDFRLQCFTNWFGCRDASEMLQPAPNPDR
jgi:hypothetical protein